jgi:hypothetical protein
MENEMPKIIDIIVADNTGQMFLILDRLPEYEYERHGFWLHAEDSGFYNQYFYRKPTKYGKAFAGREFDIPLKNGTAEKAYGQWWSAVNEELIPVEIYHPAYSTIEELQHCYVFTGGGSVERKLVTDWLDKHEPSTDYWKYDKRRALKNPAKAHEG